MRTLLIVSFLAMPLLAQVPAFNSAGVTMGHNHLIVSDVAAHKKIWVDVLGAQASGNPPIEFLKLPGSFLILTQGKPSGGSEGTSLDHFAFGVKEYNATRDKLAAAGVKIAADRGGAQREFVAIFPDGVKVEFYEDITLDTPLSHHHLHFRTTDPDGLREWYVKAFGAEVKKDGNRTITSIPGTMLSFTRVDAAAPSTQGRSLDHTGFNVRNVNEYCKKLAAIGIMCERPRGEDNPIAFVTDPAGTRIERSIRVWNPADHGGTETQRNICVSVALWLLLFEYSYVINFLSLGIHSCSCHGARLPIL
jgi:catechol 2,3-dioxygenase-like lactoylglutathione lyase family enzyme